MLSKDSEKIVPLRGSVQDWSGTKEEENLAEKKVYAKKVMNQMRMGYPDIEAYGDISLKSEDSTE